MNKTLYNNHNFGIKFVHIWILLTSLASLSSCHGEIYKNIKIKKALNIETSSIKMQKLVLGTDTVDINVVNGQISWPLLSQTTSLTVSLKSGTDSSDSPGL